MVLTSDIRSGRGGFQVIGNLKCQGIGIEDPSKISPLSLRESSILTYKYLPLWVSPIHRYCLPLTV